MANQTTRLRKSEAVLGERSPGSGPRTGRDQESPAKAAERSPSAVMQLAAEVDRLQADLAAARAKVAELEAKADVDPLLDIFNRRGFERELKRTLAYVKRYGTQAALVYLDLDGFKPVNDTHGHAAGDAVLTTVAATVYAVKLLPDSLLRFILWLLTHTVYRVRVVGRDHLFV